MPMRRCPRISVVGMWQCADGDRVKMFAECDLDASSLAGSGAEDSFASCASLASAPPSRLLRRLGDESCISVERRGQFLCVCV